MITLTIRTDQPVARLEIYSDDIRLAEYEWQAHRQLAETLHQKIAMLLAQEKLELSQLDAIGVYSGPGSFTGLRIGIAVANALAYSLNIKIVGTTGSSWQQLALQRLKDSENDAQVIPFYGAEPNITVQKK